MKKMSEKTERVLTIVWAVGVSVLVVVKSGGWLSLPLLIGCVLLIVAASYGISKVLWGGTPAHPWRPDSLLSSEES